MLLTASMAGSNPQEWRLVARDVVASEIITIETC
jgi:hypothetical protein